MAFSQLSHRQQTIMLIIIGSLIAGIYGAMRYIPQQKIVSGLNQQLAKTKAHIQAPEFPDEPDEDSETLKSKSDRLESKLNQLQTEVESYEQNLAPTDSQNVLLKISEAARAANVRFIENVPYIVTRRIPLDTKAPTKKLNKRQQRKLNKRLKKKNKLNRANGVAAMGVMPKEGELIDRLVNDLDEARPLQRVSVEGNFESLMTFIQSIQSLPWQVTIVKLDIDVNTQTPPQGVPQPLMAKMIIGM